MIPGYETGSGEVYSMYIPAEHHHRQRYVKVAGQGSGLSVSSVPAPRSFLAENYMTFSHLGDTQ